MDEDATTDKHLPAGYTLTKTPADPYVGFAVSLLLFVAALLGGLPDDVSAEDMESAVEAIGGGGMVLFGVAARMWRSRVQRGNVLR